MRKRLESHPNLSFWLVFGLLNCVLFLPALLTSQDGATFWSTVAAAWREPGRLWQVLAIWRPTPDLFRLQLEWLLLNGFVVALRPLRRRGVRILLFGGYFLALIYAIYEALMRSLYQSEPVLYSHYRMLTEGLAFLLDNINIPVYYLVLGLLGGGLFLAALFIGVRLLTSESVAGGINSFSRALLALLVLFALGQAVRYQHLLAQPEMVVSSLFYKVWANAQASRAVYKTVRSFDDSYVRRAYDYRGQVLVTKPNVYLLFVESYGSVLYKRPDYLAAYTALADELEKTLAANGWHAATALSDSPTWGGGSWMAYTSALFGLDINSDPEYSMLMERYQVDDFPDLGGFLRDQGYRYYGLSSITLELPDEKWNRYLKFYGADRWLRYRDLNYDGPKYGWGPSPPDQYALNQARAEIVAETDQPYLLFTITQNSHYPWAPLPPILADWSDLNAAGDDPTPIDAEGIPHETRRKNYFGAVEYDLRVLIDFILREEDPHALFVLVGDHQPPRVSRKGDGWDTPIHIISRDSGLVESLGQYGFATGLDVANFTPALHHAGIHSLLARLLLARYGEHKLALPAFLPDGVPFVGVLAAQSEEREKTP
ncbi:MAG: hypothetical protein DWI57_13230 [Chloroflexi bacterium]|nr:MAG: hypothetical protein DWI57_13230 [Chloroflexota bacterium]